MLRQDVTDQKPLVERLNKMGTALAKLVGDDDREQLGSTLDEDNDRYDALKRGLRQHGNALEEALQHTSAVSAFPYRLYSHSFNSMLYSSYSLLVYVSSIQK